MKKSMLLITGLLICLIVFQSCDDDEKQASAPIVGVWAGEKADFNLNPDGIIPSFTLSEDDFPVQLEFRNNGTLILTDNKGTSTAGTYEMSGNNLNINIDYEFELIALAGSYTIEELNSTSLKASTEREGTYTHPETNQSFEGKVKATLFFTRQP
jgi:hypothetical protein